MNYIYQQSLNYDKNVGVVLGSFSPLHRGHLDLIYKAKKECGGGVLVVVCGYEHDKGGPKMTLEERYKMVRQYFRDDPLVAVYALSDDEIGITEYDGDQDKWQWGVWLHHFLTDVAAWNSGWYSSEDWDPTSSDYINKLKDHLIFYTGEPSYSRELQKLGCKTKVLDRNLNTINATAIRENPIKYWRDIAWTYHRKFSHNILITGTASEGKTTLIEDIGRYFQCPFSYERPNDYMSKYMIGDWELDARDFVSFLVDQYNYNRDCIESPHSNGVFVSDSDAFITKMYAHQYANDVEMALTPYAYQHVIKPVADMFISKSHWDKIFLLLPKRDLVDDHRRYMKHSSIEVRTEMIEFLINELKAANMWDKVEILDGDYMQNFNRVKQYIIDIGGLR